MTKIEDRIAEINKKISELSEEEKQLKKKLRVKCIGSYTVDGKTSTYGVKGCGKTFAIGRLTYIQTYWYSNEAYNEGYRLGEGQFVCPGCGTLNRLCNRDEIVKLKYSFGKIEDRKDD